MNVGRNEWNGWLERLHSTEFVCFGCFRVNPQRFMTVAGTNKKIDNYMGIWLSVGVEVSQCRQQHKHNKIRYALEAVDVGKLPFVGHLEHVAMTAEWYRYALNGNWKSEHCVWQALCVCKKIYILRAQGKKERRRITYYITAEVWSLPWCPISSPANICAIGHRSLRTDTLRQWPSISYFLRTKCRLMNNPMHAAGLCVSHAPYTFLPSCSPRNVLMMCHNKSLLHCNIQFFLFAAVDWRIEVFGELDRLVRAIRSAAAEERHMNILPSAQWHTHTHTQN